MGNRYKSKLDRLRSMNMAEISYRINEAARMLSDRWREGFGFGLGKDDEFENILLRYQGSFKHYLESAAARRFFASTAPPNRDATIEVLRTMPNNIDRALKEGERLLEHRVNLLCYSNIVLGDDIDWHRDPLSGHRWETRFFADYDLVRESSADPKIIHELNRHQHLPRLAKAFLLTDDERFAREAVEQIESWIEQNARWRGINWQSSLEVALRVISWMWTIFMLMPSRALDERATRNISKSLFLQVDHIYRYPSVYSSPNTHLIGEALAMFMAGVIFQELPRSSSWREKGLTLLVTEMEQQVLADGVYFELSSYYHCYATDFFMHALVLARLNRLSLPDWMWSRLSHMIEVVSQFTRPDGTIPLIGDDDGGRVTALASEHYSSYRDGICSGAVLFGRSDFKFAAGGFAEETLWLLGSDAVAIFNSLASKPSDRYRKVATEAGYFIQRSGWGKDDSHMVFDCGGYGSSTGGHSHADALSFTLFSGGTELLIDPATSVYNGASEWRNYFRSTRAHNTVVVDGLDQSEPGDTFSWTTKAGARVLKQFDIAGLQYIDGEHDGYTRLRPPIIHRRRLLYVRPNYWVVLDSLQGNGEHTFDFLYHFAPGSELFIFGEEQNGEVDCRARVNQHGLQVSLYASEAIHAEALCGQVAPIQGWTSSRYGERKPAPVFKGSIRGFAPVSAMTFLMPLREVAGDRTRRLNVSGGRAVAAAIRDGEFEDFCVMAMDPSAKLRVMDFTMSGELFWVRSANGVLRQLLAVNAFAFQNGGEVLFQEKEPLSHLMVHFWENGMVIEHGDEEGKVYVRDLRNPQFQRN